MCTTASRTCNCVKALPVPPCTAPRYPGENESVPLYTCTYISCGGARSRRRHAMLRWPPQARSRTAHAISTQSSIIGPAPRAVGTKWCPASPVNHHARTHHQDEHRRRGDELSSVSVALGGKEQRARMEAWFQRGLERRENVGGNHGLAVGMLSGEGAAMKPASRRDCLSMMSSRNVGLTQGTSGHNVRTVVRPANGCASEREQRRSKTGANLKKGAKLLNTGSRAVQIRSKL